jgi:hypothetical protein
MGRAYPTREAFLRSYDAQFARRAGAICTMGVDSVQSGPSGVIDLLHTPVGRE